MKRITQVFKDLMIPDDQSKSWYAWATNQMSHAFLGVLVAIFAGSYWLYTTLSLAFVKEIFDLSKSFNIPSIIDSITDILFWICGAGSISGGSYRYLFIIGFIVLFSFGIYFRVKNNSKK